MSQFPVRLALVGALALVAPFQGTLIAAEQTAPQGEDPPGADNGPAVVPPPAEDGVIPPPDVGDEGIHTDVPNPGAGHEEEVIPPPEVEQEAPGAVPR